MTDKRFTSSYRRAVERAAAKEVVARQVLEAAIRMAHDRGMSLREIAAAAGVSHEQVRRIVSR